MTESDENCGMEGDSPHRDDDLVSEALLHLAIERPRRIRAEEELRELRESTTLRVGEAIADAFRGWRGLLALPLRLLRIARNRPVRGQGGQPATLAVETPPLQVTVDGALLAWSQARAGVPDGLGELRIAAVLDEFTRSCLEPDCQLELLPTSGVGERLDAFRPHFLLVESAWRGNGGTWRNLLRPDSAPLRLLLDCCRRRGIPTVFWNKEDPVHFEHFVGIAPLFDHVYTTDGSLMDRYAARGCRQPARLLRFFCQPAIHNPLRDGAVERQRAACFIGSWYRQYPERSRTLETVIDAISTRMPVEIYDRNQGRNDAAFEFPGKYASLLRPAVPYSGVPGVYKRYMVGINMNTVTGSPTMYSRRIHELAACRTIVVTNYSLGADADYGDAVIHVDGEEFVGRLDAVLDSPSGMAAMAQRALETVMLHHTARVRLSQLANEVLGVGLACVPLLRVLVAWERESCLESILASFDGISWERKCLTLVASDGRMPGGEGLRVRSDVMVAGLDVLVEDVPGSGPDERWFVAQSGVIPTAHLDRIMAATAYAGGAALGTPDDPADIDLDNAALAPGSCVVARQDLHSMSLAEVVAAAGSRGLATSGIAIYGGAVSEA